MSRAAFIDNETEDGLTDTMETPEPENKEFATSAMKTSMKRTTTRT